MGGGIDDGSGECRDSRQAEDTDQAALDRGISTIRKNYERSVKSGRMTQQAVEQRDVPASRAQTGYDGFNAVDTVIEAVFEIARAKEADLRGG